MTTPPAESTSSEIRIKSPPLERAFHTPSATEMTQNFGVCQHVRITTSLLPVKRRSTLPPEDPRINPCPAADAQAKWLLPFVVY
jgi:hypothetical protein